MTRRYCLFTDVLGPAANAAVYRKALERHERFDHSRVVNRGVDRQIRSSTVLYSDKLSDVADLLQRAVTDRLETALPRLGIPSFDLGTFEIQMTSHNDGDFFHRHTDAASRQTASRTLTYVYYFHGEPRQYTGGELVFFGPDGEEDVLEPANDMLVLFDPRTAHEVRPIRCSTGRFEDGRFTLNGWLHRRTTRSTDGTFFDRKIFTPIRDWSASPTAGQRTPTGTQRRHAELAGETQHMRALLLLYGDLHRTSPSRAAVDVRPGLRADEFFESYYAANRPVLMPGAMSDGRAVRTWSPRFFAEHYGAVEVEITAGRDASADYERQYRQNLETVTMRELVNRLESAGETNDFYLIARNNFFDNPQLQPLRDELAPPAEIIDDADRRPGSSKLWIGPQGTLTPIHFDEHSILFCQVFGRKRFTLIPSFDYPRMYVRDRFYSRVDPEHPDLERFPLFADVSVMDVVVEPGDCLLLPVAWWHLARSLTPSISATFSSFARPWTNTRLTRT